MSHHDSELEKPAMQKRTPKGVGPGLLPLWVEIKSRAYSTAWRLGFYDPPDRRLLTSVILPYYANSEKVTLSASPQGGQVGQDGPSPMARSRRPLHIVFVGVKAYNQAHHALFENHTYVTLDPNPDVAKFGGPVHHVAPLSAIESHVTAASVDVVLLNGVLGHGLDDPSEVEASLAACHRILRDGGHLVVGYNEEGPHAMGLAPIHALHRFEPFTFPPLQTSRLKVDTPFRDRSHTYLFLRKLP